MLGCASLRASPLRDPACGSGLQTSGRSRIRLASRLRAGCGDCCSAGSWPMLRSAAPRQRRERSIEPGEERRGPSARRPSGRGSSPTPFALAGQVRSARPGPPDPLTQRASDSAGERLTLADPARRSRAYPPYVRLRLTARRPPVGLARVPPIALPEVSAASLGSVAPASTRGSRGGAAGLQRCGGSTRIESGISRGREAGYGSCSIGCSAPRAGSGVRGTPIPSHPSSRTWPSGEA